MFRIRQPDPGQMEHPDLNGPLILLIYHQPSDFSRKSLKQTYLFHSLRLQNLLLRCKLKPEKKIK